VGCGQQFRSRRKKPKKGLNSVVPLGRLWPIAFAAALAVLTACGGDPEPVPQAPPYTDPGFVEAGAWRMDYALTMTRDLPSSVAGSYGIEQRPNLALLTVTLAPADSREGPPPAAPIVEATAVALTGARTALALARRDEANVPTWLASVEVSHRVPVTIEIRAHATGDAPELRARLTREFRLD
jgi:amino acid transporter